MLEFGCAIRRFYLEYSGNYKQGTSPCQLRDFKVVNFGTKYYSLVALSSDYCYCSPILNSFSLIFISMSLIWHFHCESIVSRVFQRKRTPNLITVHNISRCQIRQLLYSLIRLVGNKMKRVFPLSRLHLDHV